MFFTLIKKIFFCSADEFYRIMEDSDECLLDIVSTDEIVYILDESTEDTSDFSECATSDEQKRGKVNRDVNNVQLKSDPNILDKSLFKIPNSLTQKITSNKSTSKNKFNLSIYGVVPNFLNVYF